MNFKSYNHENNTLHQVKRIKMNQNIEPFLAKVIDDFWIEILYS